MSYPHRHILLVSAEERAAANAAAAVVDPDVGGAGTFSVPLSPTGLAPATHYGCNSAATEAMRAGMQSALPALASVRYWRLDAATDVLQQTNVAASLPRVGQALSWPQALADVGLAVVTPDGL